MAKNNKDALQGHPEVVNSGAKYFNISSNRIPQEVVPRGDVNEPTLNPYGITSSDITGLSVYANGLINEELLKTNKESALLDACLMAIRDKDGGKYDGRINANTQGLILSAMDTLSSKKVKEIEMSKEAAKKKEEAKKEPKVNPLGVGKQVGPGGKITDKSKAQTQKELSELPVAIRQSLQAKKASISERLDKVAGQLETGGNSKLAEQLDIVANTLDGISYGED